MKCLLCYKETQDSQSEYHKECSKKLFGYEIPPEMPYSEDRFSELALQIIKQKTSLTGAQPKLSLDIEASDTYSNPKRFTIVGLWGKYILKPPTPYYKQLPEVEDLTMKLAEIAHIKTVPHGLIRLQSGSLAYITVRVDREKNSKLAMEDMCQLTERLTEDKYRGSYEQIGKAIQKYSVVPGLDVQKFFEVLLFSLLSGNADMHLKNFSLLQSNGLGMALSPAYDLVNTALVNPADKEELALTLNGKKRKIVRQDFEKAMELLGVGEKQRENIFKKMIKSMPGWMKAIESSYLDDEFKEGYVSILRERVWRLYAVTL